jgi:predicted ATPase
MQQITDWLKKLGMSEYAERFAENRIDLSVLPDLTDQDLKDLGVLLGDRRKLLRAIRELDAVAATAPAAPVEPELIRRDDAERRQLREFSHALLAAVMRKQETELGSALDRLIQAGLLFRQGVPPHATYLFKHALVQDAAYGTLLREPRRALHARIADVLESQFTEIAESQPELLARHCTEAGLIEKAEHLWGKAGQRSLERSALVEAVEQLTRALAQISILPPSPEQRRDKIKLQAAIMTPLIHVKGYASPETRVAAEWARLFEQGEALGECLEDPLILFSALYGFLTINIVVFNGNVVRQLASEFLARAEKQGTTPLLLTAHRIVGASLVYMGEIVESLPHLERTIALYDPTQHRSLAMRFGQDARVAALSFRSLTLWLLGHPEAALADAGSALRDARDIGHAATLMYVLAQTSYTHVFCGNYAAANGQIDELASLAEEQGSPYWKAFAMWLQGGLLALSGKAAEAVHMLTSGLTAWRSTGATLLAPTQLSFLARAHAELGQFGDAWRCSNEAIAAVERSKERWWEAEVNRTVGEIALQSPQPDEGKAEAYFESALAIARAQHAKSWELRAAMSMARLWRDQGKRQQANDLLAPLYGWFTERFDTLHLKQAKSLLEQLKA